MMQKKYLIIGAVSLVIIGIAIFLLTKKKNDADKDSKDPDQDNKSLAGTDVPDPEVSDEDKKKVYSFSDGEGRELILTQAELLAGDQKVFKDVVRDLKLFTPDRIKQKAEGVYNKLVESWGQDKFPYVYPELDGFEQYDMIIKATKDTSMNAIVDTNGNTIKLASSYYTFWGGANHNSTARRYYIEESQSIAKKLLTDAKKFNSEIEKRALDRLVKAGIKFYGINDFN